MKPMVSEGNRNFLDGLNVILSEGYRVVHCPIILRSEKTFSRHYQRFEFFFSKEKAKLSNINIRIKDGVEISCSMQYANNLNATRHRLVKNDVLPNWKAS